MRISNRDPMDVPAPPSVDEVSKLFTVPLMSLSSQPSLSELGVGTTASSSDGGPTALDSVAISYTLWRNPGDREEVPGMRIDTDPDVFAVGASMGDRILTAVIPRDHLPYVTVTFATRSSRPIKD
jgi:hypothetical protein